MRLAVLVCAFALAAPAAASAHLVAHPVNDSREAIHASQLKNLAHAKYVCRHGGGHHQWWSCRAVTWLTKQAERTRETHWTVILEVFGPYAKQAWAVAKCESGFSVVAENGQYKGVWQMGESERAIYGHGPTFREQTEAAHRYFVASGRDWSPWGCKPW